MAKCIGKGNWNEWETARALSLWVTGGRDKTQLIRSVQSGGNITLRTAAVFQVGDLAPNGPEGEKFRSHFGVECKNYKSDPDWWHCMTYKNWIVEQWWKKINEECRPFRLEPILIMKRNARPIVVMIREPVCRGIVRPDLIIPRLNVSVITFEKFLSVEPEKWYEVIKNWWGGPKENWAQ